MLHIQSHIAKTIQSWKGESQARPNAWDVSQNIYRVCGLVADLKVSALKNDLEKAQPDLEKKNRILVLGALAALGDDPSFNKLHGLAASEDLVDRFTALEMCGHLEDEKSYQLVKNAAESTNDPAFLTARQILKAMNQKREIAEQN